jgi:ABC-type dipeptide/oligopeptide/nickel transport system permease subunit
MLFGITGSIFFACQASHEITALRECLFVQFAHSLRLNIGIIFYRHILKNCLCLPALIAKQFRDNILFLSTLSFLGFVHLENPSDLGWLIFQYVDDPYAFQNAWWCLFFPCLALVCLILCFDFVAEKLAPVEKK